MYALFLRVCSASMCVSRVFAVCVCLAAVMFWSPVVQAGPWTRGAGSLYVKIGEGIYLADSFVNAQGQVQSGAGYLGATTSAFMEIGLYRGKIGAFHIEALLPYTIARNSFEGGATYTQGNGADSLISLQYSPPGLKFPVSIRVEGKIPLYDSNRLFRQQDLTEAQALNFPALGDGQIDVTAYLAAGHSIGRFFFFGEVGYRFRTETFIGDGRPLSFVDSVTGTLQGGFAFYRGKAGNMYLMLGAQILVPVSFDDQVTKGYITPSIGFFLPFFKFGKNSIALEGSFDPTVWARNSAQGISFSLGISLAR